jgi:biofilm PGA synthesis N-glycosyltransferase PgaC
MAPHRRWYLPVTAKFAVAQLAALGWLCLSIWLSVPWVDSLSRQISWPVALFAVICLAYVPGWLVAFLAASLLLDRQPPLGTANPTRPVTVLIPAHNEQDRIGDTLLFLSRQDFEGELRVVVIDNASTDRTTEVAREAGHRLGISLTCIFEAEAGKSHALNTGLTTVQTDVVITLDADTALHPQAVRNLVARYEGAPTDVTAVAGAVLVRNSRDNIWTRMQEWDYFLGIASIKRMQGLYQGTLVAQGAFSLYETDAVRDIGGWPDAIGEDIVLTWRLMQRSGRIYFEPTAIAFTEVPSEFRHFGRQRARWARGMIEGIRAVKPWKQPQPMVAIMTALDLLIPVLDFAYTFLWMPGLVLACFGIYWFVGIYTVTVLPLTLLVNAILYWYQRRQVFRPLELRVRRNLLGLAIYVVFYQMLMSPMSVLGYTQELFGLRRRWK